MMRKRSCTNPASRAWVMISLNICWNLSGPSRLRNRHKLLWSGAVYSRRRAARTLSRDVIAIPHMPSQNQPA